MELDYPIIVQIIKREKLQFTDIYLNSGNNTFPFKNANLKMYDYKGNVRDLLHYCYTWKSFITYV